MSWQNIPLKGRTDFQGDLGRRRARVAEPIPTFDAVVAQTVCKHGLFAPKTWPAATSTAGHFSVTARLTSFLVNLLDHVMAFKHPAHVVETSLIRDLLFQSGRPIGKFLHHDDPAILVLDDIEHSPRRVVHVIKLRGRADR